MYGTVLPMFPYFYIIKAMVLQGTNWSQHSETFMRQSTAWLSDLNSSEIFLYSSSVTTEKSVFYLIYSRVTQPGTCTQPCPIVHTAVHPLFTQPCPDRTMSTIVHTAVPRENNEHGCVYLRCSAVCKLPGCVEGHPWYCSRSTNAA